MTRSDDLRQLRAVEGIELCARLLAKDFQEQSLATVPISKRPKLFQSGNLRFDSRCVDPSVRAEERVPRDSGAQVAEIAFPHCALRCGESET